MSLVAYASSDESDSEGTSVVPESKSNAGLFSLLPTPKKPQPTRGGEEANKASKVNVRLRDDDTNPQPANVPLLLNLPKPKKRSEPVRIPVPLIQKQDSDSDDDEPARKKVQAQGAGTGLSALLPQPKNLLLKEKDRALIPHTLTKRQEPRGLKPGISAQSPSAIKAAAKSAALQLARQIATDEQDEDDIAPQNYFSLPESAQPVPVAVPSLDPEPAAPVDPVSFAPTDELGQSDAPLDFGASREGAGAWGGQFPQYQQPPAGPEDVPQGYYNEPYYQDTNPGSTEAEEPGVSAMIEDEGFMRLQGKRNRGKEEVKFLEIKGDDQLSGNQQWMTKSISEEKQVRQSFSKRSGGQPTGQQRRKHQITYLIHQAKERELELKNSWAENKLTRRQTQAKYGF